MKKSWKYLGLSMLALGILGACGTDNATKKTEKASDKLSIVTTFYPMYEFTKQIVGDEANVTLLVPAGQEPHDYEPSAKDIANIQSADVFVYHNPNLENWVTKASKSWQKNAPHIIESTKNMVLLPGTEEEEGHSESEEGHSHELDPHTWLAPNLAMKEVESIKNQLAKLYPKKQAVFTANAENYLTQLTALDKEYQTTLSVAKQTSFVTQHAAFGYLALEYGLTQVPIAGLSPEQEPSPTRLAELKAYVQTNGLKYIYFEENASDKVARTLADEANVKLLVLNPLESLTKEQMKNGEDYLSVMKENLTALEKTVSVAGKSAQPETTMESKHTVANGYFEDSAVKDRTLSDYSGDWQSVYPLLQDGTLDQVFDYKAKLTKDMTTEEYKAYYETGYKTDVNQIIIKDNTMDFVVNGEHHRYTYQYKGYKIVTYKKGNRGVRYLFEATDANAGKYKYVQFSDHNIAPVKTSHFHIFFGGESQESLLDEMDNWPTYYPNSLSKLEIAQEMMAH